MGTQAACIINTRRVTLAKHFIILIIVSLLAVFFRVELQFALHGAMNLHDQLVNLLGVVFSGGRWGKLIELALALFIMPVVIGSVIAGVFWLFKRRTMPSMMEVIWILWFVLLTALVLKSS
jgi:hypothetical protein